MGGVRKHGKDEGFLEGNLLGCVSVEYRAKRGRLYR